MTSGGKLNRRTFGTTLAGAALAGRGLFAQAPAVMPAPGARPEITDGVASGEVSGRSAVVWSRTDRPARMVVEYATTASFRDARRLVGPAALPETGFTAKTILTDLPPGQRIVYRVRFQDLAAPKVYSHPSEGMFRTAPSPDDLSDVVFAWSGDTAGQGYGIDPAFGGMLTYESIRRAEPHFFLHSGDTIYADNPIPAEIRLDNGTLWRNLTTEAKSKVAETLDEYRGAFRYNLLDENVRRFNREVAQIVQWDDHETLNNWYPGEMLDDPRYAVKSVSLLSARAKRAFFEFTPTRHHPDDLERIYRTVHYGPLLEVFVLDERTYRGPNTRNCQPVEGDETAFLGNDQLQWLSRRLAASRATWKVIASDMPVGLVVGDGPDAFEAIANGDGPPLGRELEIARLLKAIKDQKIHNVVWLTADVHYAAAHYYDPAKARFTEFQSFWEFVAGPLHAGTFGPARLDDTFGPEVKFQAIPDGMKPNRPPSEGYQFFGVVRIDGKTAALTVSLHNRKGDRLYSVELPPVVG